MPAAATIRFVTQPRSDYGGALEILPAVNDRALTEIVATFEREHGMEPGDGYGGLIPSIYRFGPIDEHFLGAGPISRDGAGKVPLLGCECGEWGCWPFLARVAKAGDLVHWTDFEQPLRTARDYSALGPFTFDLRQYQSALEEVRAALAKGG